MTHAAWLSLIRQAPTITAQAPHITPLSHVAAVQAAGSSLSRMWDAFPVFWARTDVNGTSLTSRMGEVSVQVPAPGAGCALRPAVV